jgi:TonB family protein
MADEKDDIPGEMEQDELARYRSGDMSEAERHALEKKALSDPFLADALEGSETITPEEFSADIHAISYKLQHKKRSAWLIPLRIAAGVVVILASGSLIYYFTSSPPMLALEKSAAPVVASDSSLLPPKDSSTKFLSQAKPGEKTGESRQPARSELTHADINSPADTTLSNAGAGAIAAAPKPENLSVEPEQAKLKAVEAEISDDKKDIREEPAAVVTGPAGMASADKKESLASRSAKAVQSPVEAAEPLGGKPAFQKYLEAKMKYPAKALDRKTEGKVTIAFTVTTTGTLINFSIIKGIGDGCDEELIRLISEGPAWTPAHRNSAPVQDKVTVEFTFTLPK